MTEKQIAQFKGITFSITVILAIVWFISFIAILCLADLLHVSFYFYGIYLMGVFALIPFLGFISAIFMVLPEGLALSFPQLFPVTLKSLEAKRTHYLNFRSACQQAISKTSESIQPKLTRRLNQVMSQKSCEEIGQPSYPGLGLIALGFVFTWSVFFSTALNIISTNH